MDLVAHDCSQKVGNFGDRLWGVSMILVTDLFAYDLPVSRSSDCKQDVGIAFRVLKRMVGA